MLNLPILLISTIAAAMFAFSRERRRPIPISSLRPHVWHPCLDVYCESGLVRPHEILCSSCLADVPVAWRIALAKATPWTPEWRRTAEKALLMHFKLDRVAIDYLAYAYETAPGEEIVDL